tara:strand:+ start:50 stop:709 length:660 start_codon:yes stop_codon:yes gene_type:complete
MQDDDTPDQDDSDQYLFSIDELLYLEEKEGVPEEQMLKVEDDERFSKQDLEVLRSSESFQGLDIHKFNKVFITIIADSYGEEGQPKTARAHAMLGKMAVIIKESCTADGDSYNADLYGKQSDDDLAKAGDYQNETLLSMVDNMKAELSIPKKLKTSELNKFLYYKNPSLVRRIASDEVRKASTSVSDLSRNAAEREETIKNASKNSLVGGGNPTPGKNP